MSRMARRNRKESWNMVRREGCSSNGIREGGWERESRDCRERNRPRAAGAGRASKWWVAEREDAPSAASDPLDWVRGLFLSVLSLSLCFSLSLFLSLSLSLSLLSLSFFLPSFSLPPSLPPSVRPSLPLSHTHSLPV